MNGEIEMHFLQPFRSIANLAIKDVRYWDPGGIEFLSDNCSGVQIIGGQIEFEFENGDKLFSSWANIPGFELYSLSLSTKSFFNEDSPNWSEVKSTNWNQVIGKRMVSMEVFGLVEMKDQPHLAKFTWENGFTIWTANWKHEPDFQPKFPFGDDLWIIFEEKVAQDFASKLDLKPILRHRIGEK